MILDDLSSIDWSAIQLVNGPANEVPIWIIGLISLDREVRSQSYERLRTNIYHQGDVSRITIEVIPFLIQVLPLGPTDTQVKLLELLLILANVIENEKLRQENPLPLEWEVELSRSGYGRSLDFSRQYEQDTFNAVKQCIPIARTMLRQEGIAAEIQEAVKNILDWFEHHDAGLESTSTTPGGI